MSSTTTKAPDPKICEPGGSGMFVPLFAGDDEADWNRDVRAVVYGFVMVYFFLGASIISDFFMAAIEAITGKKRRVMSDNGRMQTFYIWNDTVANLTLLALGSSAPEILLSVVEVMKNEFYSGELGPSTIVGSAAFNTLIIIAVSVMAIPSPGLRYIKGNLVYNVTVGFSLFSYIWLLFICQIISKDVIEVWEAVLTLFFFFVLVFVSWIVDKYEERLEDEAEERAALMISGEAKRTSGVEDVYDRRHSVHKVKDRKLKNPKLQTVKAHQNKVLEKTQTRILTRATQRGSVFANLNNSKSDLDQVVGRGSNASAIGDAGLTPSIANLAAKSPPAGDYGQGITGKDGRRIKNNNGILTFLVDALEIKGGTSDVVISVPILRRNGTSGTVQCEYRTESIGAIPGYDYKDTKGMLVYPAGNVVQEVQLVVLPQRNCEYSESFQLILDKPEGGVLFNPNDDGKDDRGILTVTICNNLGVENDDDPVGFGQRCFEFLIDPELMQYGFDLWREQIAEAFQANPDSDHPPSVADNLMHFVSLPWKFIFACLAPPKVFCGGWLLFCVCLGLIGIMTAMVADLAETFGCCLEIEMGVTAIIVVAPGTSLPDLFASQTAAIQEEHADASIVNVTGSNSVNVFLGIGLPWTIAAIVWKIAGATDDWKAKYPDLVSDHPDGGFIVLAGSLGYSVVVFSSVAAICLGTLRIRRLLVGGELGGGSMSKNGTAIFFVLLWVWYLTWNILKSGSDSADVGQTISLALCALFIVVVGLVEVGCRTGFLTCRAPPAPGQEVVEPRDDVDALPDAGKQQADAELQHVRLLEAADAGMAQSPEAVESNVVGKPAENTPNDLKAPPDEVASKASNGKTSSTSPTAKKKKKPPAPKRSNSGERELLKGKAKSKTSSPGTSPS